MREVVFESLKWYLTPVEGATSSDTKKKGKKGGLKTSTAIGVNN
jgi:hypothetical protein